MKKLIPIALAVLALTGCKTAPVEPMQYKDGSLTTESAVQESIRMSEAWNEAPVYREGTAAVVLMTPMELPDEIANRKISLELDPGTTVTDVVAILGRLGVPVILGEADIGKKDFYLPRYNGTVGKLLSTISKATDAWFTWHDGIISVTSKERIGITVPQEEKFAEQLGKGLETLNIKDKSVVWQAGMAVVEVTPSQFRKLKAYLERYTANAAVVSLQMAVVNVSLNQDVKQGIDWSALQVSAIGGGTSADLKAWSSANAPATIPTTGVPGASGAGTATPAAATDTSALSSVASLGLSNGALTGLVFAKHFSFSGMFNFLQTYGNAETKQNVMLKTVTGNKVEFKSVTSVPYVSGVGVNNTTTAGSASSMGSTQTQKADDGITVEMTPTFDSAANTVTIDFKLQIKAVVAFNELSAGNQIGKLTQPTTAERSFTDILRVRPGQTVVVGGLTYDNYSRNKGSPLFLAGTNWESDSVTVKRSTMFIVIRPTVTKLGQVATTDSDEGLALLPRAVTPESAKPLSLNKIKK